MKPENIGGAAHIVDDQWFLISFGKQDVFFKKLELKVDGVFVETVDTGLSDGGDTVFFEKGF